MSTPVVSEDYLRFRIRFEDLITIDMLDCANWVQDHRDQLREGYRQEQEYDSDRVYALMQYVRARDGFGV